MILDLKEGKIGAINYFYDLINREICDNVTICVVPSSDLMDDVTTTGNSLYVCKEILLSKGANKVEMFALGRAI